MIPASTMHCLAGCVLAAFSIPLALRRVPMNRFYGVRIPKAFKSERNWYEINAYGGQVLAVYGLLLAGFGYLTRDLEPPPADPWSIAYNLGPILLIVPTLLLIAARARRLPDD
ncbi:MAG: SdpI family protein [Acidobacteria bacterium]|nr:SdpI family protein [Acidobacteriota bacterium]